MPLRKSEFYALPVGQIGSGLCNQLISFINGSMLAERAKKQFIVLGPFFTELDGKTQIPISEVIDLKATCDNWGLNVKLLDKSKCRLNVLNAKYGVEGAAARVDVTNAVAQALNKDGQLHGILNDVCGGDPVPGLRKTLTIELTLDDWQLNRSVVEGEEVTYDGSTGYMTHGMWYPAPPSGSVFVSAVDETRFVTLLRGLKFAAKFEQLANDVYQQFLKGPLVSCDESQSEAKRSSVTLMPDSGSISSRERPVHILHMRLEADAIAHWSRMNQMPADAFTTTLRRQYEDAVRTYVGAWDTIYVVSDALSDPLLVKLLALPDIKTVVVPKRDFISKAIGAAASGTQTSAILDLLVAVRCKAATIIGNYNFQLKRGSTFSYVLSVLSAQSRATDEHATPLRVISIDLDDVRARPTVQNLLPPFKVIALPTPST